MFEHGSLAVVASQHVWPVGIRRPFGKALASVVGMELIAGGCRAASLLGPPSTILDSQLPGRSSTGRFPRTSSFRFGVASSQSANRLSRAMALSSRLLGLVGAAG